ncbi:hypothetical protein CALVIDRAFT_568248 [Calocera viscosa TUFC12733]|uniref:PRISE-like Rossmann-fold domain-containing protein n=1 Tax=Calocera viscosa (strain TUFC12733) TaxID=1330018 RepID=A0A167HBK2_CALVF|nr:hypothetical protein CALVIDRAFT_568248 [Calocera viscosa TUFC12733]
MAHSPTSESTFLAMATKHQAPSLAASTYTIHAPLDDLPLGLPPSVPLPDTFTVHSEGIFHGLPDWSSPEYKDKTAIVAGANGISGAYMLRVMADHPEIWKTVYSISRRPPQEALPANFHSLTLDLFDTDGAGVGKALRALGVERIDYAFFYAFMPTQASDKRTLFKEDEELANINGKLLDNFLEGLLAAGLRPTRVLLQTGCKGYGQHYGPIITPVVEDDRSRARKFFEANFYYSQEDVLWKFSKKHDVQWVESRPSFIIGLVKDNNLNLLAPLLLYAAITKHMGGTELPFPGDRRSWDKLMDMSSARHNALFQQWQILAPQAANQAFHTADGSIFSWHRFWPWLGETFGLKTAPPAADDDPTVNWQSYEMYRDAAIDYPHRAVCKYTFLMADWVQEPEVREAWKDMADKYKLDTTLMKQDYMWSIADFAITIWWNLQLNLDKARKLGYFGTVDSFESIEETVQLAVDMAIIPSFANTIT